MNKIKNFFLKSNLLPVFLAVILALSSVVASVFLTFAIWTGASTSQPIVTEQFNPSEDDFEFYAAIPNVSSEGGYDYYPLDQVPEALQNSVEGLAVAKYEAFNETVYIPSYPEVTINKIKYNEDNKEELPVIDVLAGYYSSADTMGSNGIAGNQSVKYIILPDTLRHVYSGSFSKMTGLKKVTVLGATNYYYKLHLTNYQSIPEIGIWSDEQDTSVEDPYDMLVLSEDKTFYYSKNDLLTYKVDVDGSNGTIEFKSVGHEVVFTDSEAITHTALTFGKSNESYYTYPDKLYIEPGAFTNDSGTNDITISKGISSYTLGAGHTIDVVYEDESHIANGTGFSYSTSKIFMNQFSFKGATGSQGHFTYLGSIDTYVTTFIPKEDITLFTIHDNVNNTDKDYPVNFKAYTKYEVKLKESSFSTADSKKYDISYTEYTYELQYTDGGTKHSVPLSLNKSQTTNEEYKYLLSLGGAYPSDLTAVQKTHDYVVGGDIDGTVGPTTNIATFDLGWTNAYYNKDSSTFDISFSPNRIYQSTHYYSSSNEDLQTKVTKLNINAEKVYYLNQVSKHIDGNPGNESITVTFNNPNNWDAAFILAYSVYDTSKETLYYDGKSNPTTLSEDGTEPFNLMTKYSSTKFTYTFDLTYGTPMYIKFAQGASAAITKYPTPFVSEDNLQNYLEDNAKTRIYLDTTVLGDISGNYYYVHYSSDKGSSDVQLYRYSSDYYYADIPETTQHIEVIKSSIDGVSNLRTDNTIYISESIYFDNTKPTIVLDEGQVSDNVLPKAAITLEEIPYGAVGYNLYSRLKLEIPSGETKSNQYYFLNDNLGYGDRSEILPKPTGDTVNYYFYAYTWGNGDSTTEFKKLEGYENIYYADISSSHNKIIFVKNPTSGLSSAWNNKVYQSGDLDFSSSNSVYTLVEENGGLKDVTASSNTYGYPETTENGKVRVFINLENAVIEDKPKATQERYAFELITSSQIDDSNARGITIIKGTVLSVDFYNPITKEVVNLGWSSTEHGTDGSNLFIESEDHKFLFLEDCNVYLYFKVDLDSEGHITNYRYWFSVVKIDGNRQGYEFRDAGVFENASENTEFTLSSDGDNINENSPQDDSLQSGNISINGSTSVYEKYTVTSKDEGVLDGNLISISTSSNYVTYFSLSEALRTDYLDNKAIFPNGYKLRGFLYYKYYNYSTQYVDFNKLYVEYEPIGNGMYVSTNINEQVYFQNNSARMYYIQPQIVDAVTNEIILMGESISLYSIRRSIVTTNTINVGDDANYTYMAYSENDTSNTTTLPITSVGTISEAISSGYLKLNNNYFYIDISSITADLNLFEIDVYNSSNEKLNTSTIKTQIDSATGFAYFDKSAFTNPSYIKIVFNTFKTEVNYPSIYVDKAYQLTRNLANTAYEEYYYNGSEGTLDTSKNYVVSASGVEGELYQNKGGFNSNYYGTSTTDDSLGLFKFDGQSAFAIFTPNKTNAYSQVTYEIYDETDSKIGELAYDPEASLENKYQTFQGTILNSGDNTSYFYIKSTGSNPEVVGVFIVNNDGSFHFAKGTEYEVLRSFFTERGNTYFNREETSVPVSNESYATLKNSTVSESNNYEYYLVGDLNNWRINDEYAINYDGGNGGDNDASSWHYYTIKGVYLKAGESFSVSNGTDYFAFDKGTFSNVAGYDDVYDFNSSLLTIDPLRKGETLGSKVTISTSGYYDLAVRYAKTPSNGTTYYNYYLGIKESSEGKSSIKIYFQNDVNWKNVYIHGWNEQTGAFAFDENGNGAKMSLTAKSVDGSKNWYVYNYEYRYADNIPTKVYFSTTDNTDFNRTIDIDFEITTDVAQSGSMFFTSSSVNGQVATNVSRTLYLDVSEMNKTDYRFIGYFTSTSDASASEYIPFEEASTSRNVYKLTLEKAYDQFQIVVLSNTSPTYTNAKSSDYVIYCSDVITISNLYDGYSIVGGENKALEYTPRISSTYLTIDSTIDLSKGYRIILFNESNQQIQFESPTTLKSGRTLSFINPNPLVFNMIRIILGSGNDVKQTDTRIINNVNNYNVSFNGGISVSIASTYNEYNSYIYNASTPFLYYVRTSLNWSNNAYGLLFDEENDTFYADGINLIAGNGVRLYRYDGTPYTIQTTDKTFSYDTNDSTSLIVNATGLYTVTTKVTSNTREVNLRMYTTQSYIISNDLSYNVATVEVYKGNNILSSNAMVKGKNANTYHYDMYLEDGYTLKFYLPGINQVKKVYTVDVDTAGVYRISFASNGGMTQSVSNPMFNDTFFTKWTDEYVKISGRKATKIVFSPGAIFNGAYIQNTGIETEDIIDGEAYPINITQQNNVYYIGVGERMMLSYSPLAWTRNSIEVQESPVSVYSALITTNKFNQKVSIFDRNFIKVAETVIVYPGSYYLYYCQEPIYKTSSSEDLVNVMAERIQGDTKYHLVIGDKEYENFDNAYNGLYIEYTLNGTASVSTEIDLKENPIYVKDNNGNIASKIDSITLYDYQVVDINKAVANTDTIIYDYSNFKNYTIDNPEFAIYLTNTQVSGSNLLDSTLFEDGEFVSMNAVQNHYEVKLTDSQLTYKYYILYRMKSGTTKPSFDTAWNSTTEMTLANGKYVKVTNMDGNVIQEDHKYHYYVFENGDYKAVYLETFNADTVYYDLKIKSTSLLPSGVFRVNYSVDTRRRTDDRYFVFTYLTFTTVPAGYVTVYYYQDDVYDPSEDYYAAEVFVDTGAIDHFEDGTQYFEITEATSFSPNEIYYVRNERNIYDQTRVKAFEDGKTYYTIREATEYKPNTDYYYYKFSEVVINGFKDGVQYYEYKPADASTYSVTTKYYVLDSYGEYIEANPQPKIFDDNVTYYVMTSTNTFIEGKTYYTFDRDASQYVLYENLELKDDLSTASRTSSSSHYKKDASYYYFNTETNTYDPISSSSLRLKENTYYILDGNEVNNSSTFNVNKKYYEETSANSGVYQNANVHVGNNNYTLNSDKKISYVGEKDTASVYYYEDNNSFKAINKADLVVKDGYYYLDSPITSINLGEEPKAVYYILGNNNSYISTNTLKLKDSTYYSYTPTQYGEITNSKQYDDIVNNSDTATKAIYSDEGNTLISSNEPIVGTTSDGQNYYKGYEYTTKPGTEYSEQKMITTSLTYNELVAFFNSADRASRYYDYSYYFDEATVTVQTSSGARVYDLYYREKGSWNWTKCDTSTSYNRDASNFDTRYEYGYGYSSWWGGVNATTITSSNGDNVTFKVKMYQFAYDYYNDINPQAVNGYAVVENEKYDSSKLYYIKEGNTYTKVDSVNFTKTYYYESKGSKFTEYTTYQQLLNATEQLYRQDEGAENLTPIYNGEPIDLDTTYYQVTPFASNSTYDESKKYLEQSTTNYYSTLTESQISYSRDYYYEFNNEEGNVYSTKNTYYSLVDNNYVKQDIVNFDKTYYAFTSAGTYYDPTKTYYTYNQESGVYVKVDNVEFAESYYYDFTNIESGSKYDSSMSYFEKVDESYILSENPFKDTQAFTSGLYYVDETYNGSIDGYIPGKEYVVSSSLENGLVKTYDVVDLKANEKLNGYYTLEDVTNEGYKKGHIYYAVDSLLSKANDLTEGKFNTDRYFEIVNTYTSSDSYDSSLDYYTTDNNGESIYRANIVLDDVYYNISNERATEYDSSKSYVSYRLNDISRKIVDEETYKQSYELVHSSGDTSALYNYGYFGKHIQYVQFEEATTLISYEELGNHAPEGMEFKGWSTTFSVLDRTVDYIDGAAIVLHQEEGTMVLYPVFGPATYDVFMSIGQGYVITDEDGTKLSDIKREIDTTASFKIQVNTGYDASSVNVKLINKEKEDLSSYLSVSNNVYTISASLKEDVYIVVTVDPKEYEVQLSDLYNDNSLDRFDLDQTTITLKYNELYSVPVPQNIKSGYSFVGWYYNNEKMTDSTGKSLVKWTKDINNSNIVFSAKFIDVYTLKITSVDEDANILSVETTMFNAGEKARFSINTALPGYTFRGFSINNETTGDSIKDQLTKHESTSSVTYSFEMPSSNVAIVASYQLDVYTISYNLNGGTVATPNKDSFTIKDESFTLVNPTKEGYKFAGWTGTNISLSKTITIAHGSTGSRNYIATWEADRYTVTYDYSVNDSLQALIDNPNPTSFTISSGTITLKKPTLDNYTFIGWYEDETLKTEVTSISYLDGNVTLYGYFEPTLTTFISFYNVLMDNSPLEQYKPSNIGGDYVYISIFTNKDETNYYIVNDDDGGTDASENSTDGPYTTTSQAYTVTIPKSEYLYVYHAFIKKEDINNIKWKEYINGSDDSFSYIVYNTDKIHLNETRQDNTNDVLNCVIFKGIEGDQQENEKWNEKSEIQYTLTSLAYYASYYDGLDKSQQALSSFSYTQHDLANYTLYNTSDDIYLPDGNGGYFKYMDGYTIPVGNATNAGRYFALLSPVVETLTNENGEEYQLYEDMKVLVLVVFPKEFDMSGVKFESKYFEYDGSEKSLAIEGALPKDVTVDYEYYAQDGTLLNNLPGAPGSYYVKAVFNKNSTDFNLAQPESLEAVMVIYDKNKTYYNNEDLGVNGYFYLMVNDRIEGYLTTNNQNTFYIQDFTLKEGDQVRIQSSNGNNYLLWSNSDIPDNYEFEVKDSGEYSFYLDLSSAKVTVAYDSANKEYSQVFLYVNGKQIVSSQFYKNQSFVATSEIDDQYLSSYVAQGGEKVEIYFYWPGQMPEPIGINSSGRDGEKGNSWKNYETIGLASRTSDLYLKYPGEYKFKLDKFVRENYFECTVEYPLVPVYVECPSTFSTPYVHYWSGANTSMVTWPGTLMVEVPEMAKEGTKTYTANIDFQAEKVIFNHEEGTKRKQTADLDYSFASGMNFYVISDGGEQNDPLVKRLAWLQYIQTKNVYDLAFEIDENSTSDTVVKDVVVTATNGELSYDKTNNRITITKLDQIYDSTTKEFGKVDFKITLIFGNDESYTFLKTYQADGTDLNPILIKDDDDFKNGVYNSELAQEENLYFLQTGASITANISDKPFTSKDLLNDENSVEFKGIYDGANNSITYNSSTLNSETNLAYGLFGIIGKNAEVKNIKLKINYPLAAGGNNGAGDTGKTLFNIGSVASLNYGIIDNVTVTSDTRITFWANEYIGGFVGSNYGTIKNSTSKLEIICHDYSNNLTRVVGGIAGYNAGTISNVYVTNATESDTVTIISSGKDGQVYFGLAAGINAGTLENITYKGTIARTEIEAFSTSPLYGAQVKGTIPMDIDAMWKYDTSSEDKIVVCYVEYYSDNLETYVGNYVYGSFNNYMDNIEIMIFEGTSSLKIGRYETTISMPVIEGDFANKARYGVNIATDTLTTLLSQSGAKLVIIPGGEGDEYTARYETINTITQNVVNTINVIDKSNELSQGNVIRVYNIKGSTVLGIDSYEIGALVDNEVVIKNVKIYDGAESLIIAKLTSGSEEYRKELIEYTIKEVSSLDLYLYKVEKTDSSGEVSYTYSASWGYDNSKENISIEAQDLVKTSFNDYSIEVYYYDANGELFTKATYLISENDGSFRFRVFKDAVKFEFQVKTDSGVSDILEVSYTEEDYTNKKFIYWFNASTKKATGVFINDDIGGTSSQTIDLISSFSAFNTSKVKVYHYDIDGKLFHVDIYNAKGASKIKFYDKTKKIGIAQYSSKGDIYTVEVPFDSTYVSEGKSLVLINQKDSVIPNINEGTNAFFINRSLVSDETLRIYIEYKDFADQGAKVLAIQYDDEGNVKAINSFPFNIQVDLTLVEGTTKVEVSRLFDTGNENSFVIDLALSSDKTSVKIDYEGNIEFVDSSYKPSVAKVDVINQNPDWASTSEVTYDTKVIYYNASTQEFTSKIYETAEKMQIDIFLGTAFIKLSLVNHETDEEVYNFQVPSIDVNKKLYLIKTADGRASAEWSNTPSTIVYSQIPVVFDYANYTGFKVDYYNSKGILSTTYLYDSNPDVFEYIEDTSRMVVTASSVDADNPTYVFEVTKFSLSKSLHFGISNGIPNLTWGDNAYVESLYRATVENNILWWFDNGALTKVYTYDETNRLMTIDTYDSNDIIYIKIYQGAHHLALSRLVNDKEETVKTVVATINKDYILRLSSPAQGYVSTSWVPDSSKETTSYIYLDVNSMWKQEEGKSYKYYVYYKGANGGGWEEMKYHAHSSSSTNARYRASWDTIVSVTPTFINFAMFESDVTVLSKDTALYMTDQISTTSLDISVNNVYKLDSSAKGKFLDKVYVEFNRVYLYIANELYWPSYYVKAYATGSEENAQIVSMSFSDDYTSYYADIYSDLTENIIFASSFDASAPYTLTTGVQNGYTTEEPLFALSSLSTKGEEANVVHGSWHSLDISDIKKDNSEYDWYLVGSFQIPSWSVNDAVGMNLIGHGKYESSVEGEGTLPTNIYMGYINAVSNLEFKVLRGKTWDNSVGSYGPDEDHDKGFATDSTTYAYPAQFDGNNFSMSQGKYIIIVECTDFTETEKAKHSNEVVQMNENYLAPKYVFVRILSVND